MKKMVYAFVFCMLLTVPASVQPAPQTGKSGKQALKEEKKAQQLCQKHADWTIDDCRQIAQGHTWIGMTEGMLYALYGRPRSFSTEQTEDGAVTVLRYTDELPQLVRAWTTEPQLHNGFSKQQQYCYGHQKYQYFQILMLLLVYGRRDWSRNNQSLPATNPKADFVPREIDITGKAGARVKVQSSAATQEKKALKSFKKLSPPTKPNTGLRPVIDETEEGTFTALVGGQQRPKEVIVGGVQPPAKSKASFYTCNHRHHPTRELRGVGWRATAA